MKRKRSGFVFVETLIVVSILAVSLIVVYRSFSTTITNEKRRLNYDNVVYLYRTYYILEYFRDNGLDGLMNDLANKPDEVVAVEILCSNYNLTEKSFCEKLSEKDPKGNRIRIYLMKNNIKDLLNQKIKEVEVSPGAISYLRTKRDLNKNDFLFFIEFIENCDEIDNVNMCDYNYASLKVGG